MRAQFEMMKMLASLSVVKSLYSIQRQTPFKMILLVLILFSSKVNPAAAQSLESVLKSRETQITFTASHFFEDTITFYIDDRSKVVSPRRQPAPPTTDEEQHQQATFLALSNTRTAVNIIDNQILIIKSNREEINKYLVEINKKYSIPFACIVFVFIGAPLGIMARRGTFGIAASLSLGFFLLYWASLIGGEKLGDRGLVSPWLGMWIANIVLSMLGIFLTLRMGRETPRINWHTLRRFVPTFLRTPEHSAAEEELVA